MRFASVEPSAATVHWTVALRWFESFPSGIIKRVIPFGITLFMIRRKGLDLHFRFAKIMVATSVCTGGRNCPLDSSTAIGSSPFLSHNIKRVIPFGITLLMVRRKGLEPPTY